MFFLRWNAFLIVDLFSHTRIAISSVNLEKSPTIWKVAKYITQAT